MRRPAPALSADLAQMNRLIDGYQTTTLVYAALGLGLPEHMGAAPCTAQELASATGAPPLSPRRH